MTLRLAARAAALALAAGLLAAPAAHAGRQRLFQGPLALRAFTFQSVQFSVPGDWMRDPRLRGRLEVSGAGRRDVEILVLRDSDLASWEKNRLVLPIYAPPRGSGFDLDVPLPAPGTYVLVLSNRFSKLTAKQVAGEVTLTWAEDPALPAGTALRGRVRFLPGLPAAGRHAVRLHDADSASAASLARERPSDAWAIAVRRPGDRAPAEYPVGSYSGAIEEAGTVDVHGDGDRDLFLTGTSRDSAGAWRDLILVCPRQRALLTLSLGPPPAAGAAPLVRYGADYAQARFATEQSFLERVRAAYTAP